jgi:hypothetical protein
MDKKQKIQTSMEYLVAMKDYLGDDKMENFINQRFANIEPESRKKLMHHVNKNHAALHAAKPKERPQIEPTITRRERKPRSDKFGI